MVTVANTPTAWSGRADAPTSWEAGLQSERGQTLRFRALLEHLDLREGDSVLDYGCGTARLCEWMPYGVAYSGYDWSEELRARAAREHPSAEILAAVPDRLFDHVVAVGPFNLADNWWKQRTWDLLTDLWMNVTRRTLSVSVLRHMPGRDSDGSSLLYTAHDLAVFAQGLDVHRFVIDGDYLDNDLLLVLRR